MLKEKIDFKNELPVNVLVADIDEYPIHFHEEIEIVYVMKGSVRLRNGYYNYDMKSGDIFILNDREIHSFTRIDEKENMVMMLQLDLTYFSAYYKNLKNNFFVTDMDHDDDESLDVLRNILARIMMEVMQKGYGYEHKVIESAHNLIACLQSDFQYFLMEDGKFVNETKKKGNKILTGRINRITDYMYENYYRKLTLNEIAEREHLSIYYLSHVIKESTGLSFQNLLSFIRVEESEKLLLGTNKKLGVIADETGFSAVRYYIKHFETWFGMNPAEYREKYTGKVSSRESAAVLKRSTPTEIEGAIREQVKGVYSDYVKKHKMAPVIVNLGAEEEEQPVKEGAAVLEHIMERPLFAPAAGPYKYLMNLRETVLARGENYIVSSREKYHENINTLSILVYNFDRQLGSKLCKAANSNDIIRDIKGYSADMEALVRCVGLSGDFVISRYKVSKENILTAFGRASAGKHNEAEFSRQALTALWVTLPTASFSSFSASDTLSLRSTLSGFSAELILVDRKEK